MKDNDSDAELTSGIVERLSEEITKLLLIHPINISRFNEGKPLANCILFRGCSRAPELPKFIDYHNLNWRPLMMARTCIISGIGQELGFNMCTNIGGLEDQNDYIETDETILTDIEAFVDNLHLNPKCCFAFFHIKNVDEASHEQDHFEKIRLIEYIDTILGSTIDKIISEFPDDSFRIILTGDHTTLSRIGEHSCEPVPFIVSSYLNRNIQKSCIESYNFKRCIFNNNLGRFSGCNLIAFIAQLLTK